MRFAKRLVDRFELNYEGKSLVKLKATNNLLVTVYAHVDNETKSQLFGVEVVNKLTGEVHTEQYNLPADKMYSVEITEILEVQE